ncbi:carotenoid oxygenase family protein [Gordonia sp. KTR9]|uniref:carotenoid oxygenase family protein n=1 Tax=Gordonia sp. KTR9 TaxID=337191 RepID=UPI00027DDC0F|nr:carotenoid oxygenase family protein [Gordonia sp. KTR9]AFR48194.1 carotenoid oxygenase [Gordonia sp. KTR9]
MGMEQRGVFWPMAFEATVPELRVVEGEIPKDIYGGLYHNGPTVHYPARQGIESVFTTDGMVQGLILENGKASFRNRWVRTPKFLAEEAAGRALFDWEDCEVSKDWRAMGLGDIIRNEQTEGVSNNTAMVNAFPFAGEIYACGEQVGSPIRLDPLTLETKGFPEWGAGLSRGIREPVDAFDGNMSPHPKWDAKTGLLYGWGYSDRPPYVTLHWVYPDGTMRSRPITDAPYNTVAHDAWLSENYFILPFQPFTLSSEKANKGLGGYGWEVEKPIMLALVDRFNIDAEIIWVTAELPPQYMMHMLSANEVGDTIQLDGPLFGRPPFQTDDMSAPGDPFIPFFQVAPSKLGRWTIDLRTKTVKSEVLDDVMCELPKIDERFFGQPYDWGVIVGGSPSDSRKGAMRMDTLIRRNMRTGSDRRVRLTNDKHETPFEPAFIPRAIDAGEGDGYLIVPISKFAAHLGEFQIFDTDDIAAGPICRIELPFHMGWTPHGHWMDFRGVDTPSDLTVSVAD